MPDFFYRELTAYLDFLHDNKEASTCQSRLLGKLKSDAMALPSGALKECIIRDFRQYAEEEKCNFAFLTSSQRLFYNVLLLNINRYVDVDDRSKSHDVSSSRFLSPRLKSWGGR